MTSDRGAPSAARLIAIDWGTSSLRAYLMGDAGAVLDRRAEPLGILNVADRDFASVFDAITGGWRRQHGELPAIASGMIGSAQGWLQAPYVDVPADAGAVARGLLTVPDRKLQIVPGVAQRGDSPDVMRGEETQVFGALVRRPEFGRNATVVMPGTHSKWVRIAEGGIAAFTTYMTGELFAVLRAHSILGRMARADTPASDEAAARAFIRGVHHAAQGSRGLSSLIFSARSAVLVGDLAGDESLDYLSGLLIGDEIRAGLDEGARPDAIIGEPALCARYGMALACFGVHDVAVIDDAAPAGLWSIASLATPTLQRGEGSSRRPVSGRAN